LLTGKRFKLGNPTLALDVIDGKRVAVTVPARAIIKVISGPRHGDRMVDAFWNGRTVMMFAVDVKERGTEVRGRSAKA
jgi:hypothetical protein